MSDHDACDKVCLTVKEVAQLLRVSTRHVWSLVKQGNFPDPIRLGKCVRWRKEDIERLIRGESRN